MFSERSESNNNVYKILDEHLTKTFQKYNVAWMI